MPVKKLTNAFTTSQNGMLKVQHDSEKHQSRTSLASIFEDLASIRKSILGNGSHDSASQRSWVEKTFMKRECSKFIRSTRDPAKCCCGRQEGWPGHLHQALGVPLEERWHPYRHTEAKVTDAYGVLEFQGAPHPSKAQYVRLSSYDSKADQVMQLLTTHWGLDLPKLLITVHGGILNFDLQPKLKRVFRKGLLKAAKTTGAWIITGGTNTGVTRHVGDAISDHSLKAKNKIIAIGIAPWGIVENKDDLVGKDVIVPYHCVSSPRTNYSVLNNNHSYFLLVDNGTVGKYGGEIIFRKRLEKYIAHQKIGLTNGVKGRGVPVICVVLEGGANTIRSVLEYVTDTPPVPVVVCDGSGRAADLLAFTHKYCLDDGTMPESLRDQLILTIQKTFQYSQEQAEKLFIELMLCVKKKELITVFRMGEGAQDIDLAILTALLKGTNASAPDQLSLALTWDRVDIARSHIFVYGQEWPEGSLEQAMMDALINDRVDFVKLLLENGVHMQSFLTIPRLEELYNTRQGPSNTLRYLVRDIRKHLPSGYRYTLLDIGLVIQQLMGGAFRATYCRRKFRQKYNALKRTGTSVGNMGQLVTAVPTGLVGTKQTEELFAYPFHDLMIWAVLMKRQKMALFMWQHGEEAMAKALMACKLYRGMAQEADQDDLEIEIPDEIRTYAQDFQTLALELLEHCYKIDDDYTQQLLTYELKNFSEQTCLSLAVMANHREFVAHTCSQVLLNDMWMGGLRMRKSTSMKVLLGIFLPPYIAFLEFKSKEELQLMPQTMEEHLDELDSNFSDNENMSISSGFDEDPINFAEEIEATYIPQSSPVKENGAVVTDMSFHNNQIFRKKKSPLRLGKKIYEFYNAPITKFWANTLFYFVFLLFYTYIVLGKTLPTPRWQEYYVMGYIATLAVEKFRQLIVSEPTSVLGKVKVFFGSVWNVWDTVSIVSYVAAVIARFCPVTPKLARVLYTINIVFWYLRILEILSVNKYLGPYLKIIVKLLREMCYFLIVLVIVVASFGVVRQAIHFQEEEPSWFHVRSMFFYPYFMIYGELFADEIDTCTDPLRVEKFEKGEIESPCTYGSWVAPLYMFPFLLMAIVLMVNLLIARFNACFLRFNTHTMKIWKFQRYQLIVNYELRPILPPPLITLSHIYLFLKFIKRRCQGKRDNFDSGLKLFLSHDDMEKLHDFEEECAEDYFREKELQAQTSSEKRIQTTNERVENMNLRIDDMNQKENFIMLSLQTMDHRMSQLEEMAMQNMDVVSQLRGMLATYDSRGRHVSGASTRSSSRARLDSEDSGNDPIDIQQYEEQLSQQADQQTPGATSSGTSVPSLRRRRTEGSVSESEKSLTPDNSATMRSLPSPILVHSKHGVKEDSLQKYTNTDLSKPQTSLKSSLSLSRRLERQTSLKNPLRSLPRVTEHVSEPEAQVTAPSSSPTEQLSSTPLLERRHGHIPKLHIASQPQPTSETTQQEETVTVHEDENITQNAAHLMYSTAHMDTETTLATKQPATIQVSVSSEPSSSTDHSLTPLNIDIPAAQDSSQVQFHAPHEFQPAHSAIPFTPILTSRSAEYTTITDEIDTSCMMSRSPPRSPTSALPYSGAEQAWEDGLENSACRMEKVSLRQAEEIERRRMDKVIRNRLRQISMDESDSISDIAKLVISEMDIEDNHSDHEDDESLHGSSEDLSHAEDQTCTPETGETGPITFQVCSERSSRSEGLEVNEAGASLGTATSSPPAMPVEIRIRRASTLDDEQNTKL